MPHQPGFLLASGLAEAGANISGILPWGAQVAAVVVVLVTLTALLLMRGTTARLRVATALWVAVLSVAALLLLPTLERLITVA